MRRQYHRFPSRAARWSPRFGWLGVTALAGGIVLHRFGWLATSDVGMFSVLAASFALVALALAARGFHALWNHGYKGGMAAFKGGLLSLVTLLPFAWAGAAWVMLPPLHEVSTDTATPPAFLPGSRPADALPVGDNLAAQAQEQLAAWLQLSSRRYDGSPDSILKAVYAVLKAKGWPITARKGDASVGTQLLVQALAKTWVMGFVSDIVIRLTDEGDTTFVDIRSASRYLPRDFGINARFAIGFMDALDTEVLLTPVDPAQE